MKKAALVSLAAALATTGCVHMDFNERADLVPGRTTALDEERPYGGWDPATTVPTAEATWLYAQLSNNAYDQENRTGTLYDLGPAVTLLICREDPYYGMDYAVFEVARDGQPVETVIAYRGTQFTHWNDWWHGNFRGRQNLRGLAIYDFWREHLGRSASISVTGHSLGGGIATHVSLNRPNVSSVVFNSSPVFWREGAGHDNPRRSVVENWEILALLRLPGDEPTQVWTELGCTSGENAVDQHSISKLAHCLTLIAGYRSDEARASICRNNMVYPSSWRTRQPDCTTDLAYRPAAPLPRQSPPLPDDGSQPCRRSERGADGN